MYGLPEEIWVFILALLSDEPLPASAIAASTPQSLLYLSLVSKFFNNLVRPFLFRQMTFSLMSPPHLERSAAALRALEQDPESHLFVHRLHLVMWKKTVFDVAQLQGRPSAFQRLVKLFPRMKNLRWLKIDHSTITTEMYDHLYNLPFLTHFECWNVLVQQRENAYPSPSSLGLTTLTMYNVHHGDKSSIESMCRLSLAPHLCYLHCSTPVAHTLFNLHIYSTISFGAPSLPSLITFDGPGPSGDQDIEQFSAFLNACPSLTHISLSRPSSAHASSQYTTRIHPRFTLPPTVLPKLRSINASIDVVSWLIPKRPVTSVTILGNNNRQDIITADAMAPIASGSVHLRELILDSLVWQPDTFRTITKPFTKLEKLTVFCSRGSQEAIDEWLMHRFVKEVSRLPFLRSLCITTLQATTSPQEQAKFERYLLQQTVKANPALEEVQFSDYQWQKEDD
ncbi:hypothetical protein FRC03_004139 [Tulasnella sp. 419]|nr:hypothetical protein FRC03_004139 [Tulasnella sp. 419]